MLHFIVNPNKKKLVTFLEELKARLEKEGVEYEVLSGASKEETRQIAGRLSESGPVKIVAVGGDGTLNDVLSGITVPENVELGLIPFGTGNDFAEAAKIPTGIAALDLILKGEAVFTDFIECEGGLRSMNIAGLGIDVDILERCSRKKGRGKYFRSLLASIFKYKGQKIEVTVGGKQFSETAFIAAVCNGKQFGGGIPICPPAVLDDGKLDLLVVACPKRIKIPFLLIKLMRGKILSEPIVKHILCEEARIAQETGTVMQLDGELVPSQILSARVVTNTLRMFRG